MAFGINHRSLSRSLVVEDSGFSPVRCPDVEYCFIRFQGGVSMVERAGAVRFQFLCLCSEGGLGAAAFARGEVFRVSWEELEGFSFLPRAI